jgi:two-component system CheB/CheR fusion protein
VLDRDLRVLIWNTKAEDLWGLRLSEVIGQHFLNLDIGLPVEQLGRPLRNGLSGEPSTASVTLAAMNRRGKPIQCRVTCTPVAASASQVRGIIVIMEEGTE